MTVSPAAVDHLQPACAALERSTPLLAEVMRLAPADRRPAKMRWTNGEIAAHMYASVTEGTKLLRGEPSMYDVELSAELDERMVAQVTERDPAVLAGLVERRTAEFVSVARGRSGSDPVDAPRGTVGAFVGLLALDHHLHGAQFADTSGAAWTGRVADLHAPLSVVVPYAFDPEAARGFTGSYSLQLRGVQPVRYGVRNGQLQMDLTGRTDCTISTDTQTFLRLGIGVLSQARAALTGKMRPGGRKPWLAFKVDTLFPAIPHGGVAR